MADQVTLEAWLLAAVREESVQPELVEVVRSIATACAELSTALQMAAVHGYFGSAETINVHGETQKALDVVANELFVRHLSLNPVIGLLVSEEIESVVSLDRPAARYGVSFDPLDGSSNADVNMTIGSIFSVHAVASGEQTLLTPGRRQVAAGFAAYGPATSLVLTFGNTAALFQLSPAHDTFVLLDPALAVPVHSREYAINSARASHWDEAIAEYIADRVAGPKGLLGQAFNMRWTGSMVADVQRILRRGGVFLYPADAETRHLGGRLRLLYEAAPIAMIVEAAGGRASTGHVDLLDVHPTDIHQRVPVILGSAAEVALLVEAYARLDGS